MGHITWSRIQKEHTERNAVYFSLDAMTLVIRAIKSLKSNKSNNGKKALSGKKTTRIILMGEHLL